MKRKWQRIVNARHIYISSYASTLNISSWIMHQPPHVQNGLKLELSNIATKLHNVQKLTLMFDKKCDRNVLLFWQLLNPIIKKTKCQVIVLQKNLSNQESLF